MKLLSKYKDYYDYLTGIYGVDPKIVLDRRKFQKLLFPLGSHHLYVFLCGKIYEGWFQNGKIYWGENLLELGEEVKGKSWRYNHKEYRQVKIKDGTAYLHSYVALEPYKDANEYNVKEGCPIMVVQSWPIHGTPTFINYPILKELDFNKYLTAQEIYLILTEWLAPKENVTDNRTDKEKIVSAGFDTKTSFRNIK